MKRILLIGGMRSDAKDLVSLKEFYQYLRTVLNEDYAIQSLYLDELTYDISPSAFAIRSIGGIDLKEFDAVYIRGPKMRLYSAYAYYVSRYCDAQNIPCVNDYSLYYPGTKIAQTIIFKEAGASFLRTLYSINKHELIAAAAKELGYPFILKTNVGSHGDSNYLVKSKEQANAILANEPNVDFVAQSFCPNDRDYRLLITGSTHLLFERRGSADTHLNNTSKGAVATHDADALPNSIIVKAREVSSKLNLMISGVDVMPHLETGELYFLEINSQPQLRTGALLDKKRQHIKDFFDTLL